MDRNARGFVSYDARRAALWFFGLFVGLELLAALASAYHLIDWALPITASLTSALANATGVRASAFGPDVFLASRILNINVECTGVYLMAAVAALVIATPASWRSRSAGVLLGIAAVVAANMVRLVITAHIAGASQFVFGVMHDYLFQVALLFVVFGVWSVWRGGYARHAC
jgi:exosortase/archaeosortase family protein